MAFPLNNFDERQRLLLVLTSIAIVLGAFAAVLFVLTMRPEMLQQQQTYQITIALICFMASSVSGLLFATGTIKLEGKVGFVVVTLAGPATMWLISFLLFIKFVDTKGP